MRLISKIALAGLTGSFLLCASAHADPFDPKQVPADAKWVLHVDMDAARSTHLWDIMSKKMDSNADYQAKLAEVQTITGMQFPQDLHDATLFGSAAGEEAGVVLIHGKMDQTKTLAALQKNPSYASQAYGQYQVLTWDDNGKKMYGAFHDETHVIVGRSQENIQGALDTMDAKAPAIAATSALAAGSKPDLLVYVAASDLPALNQAQSPIAGQLDNVWVSITEKGDNDEVQANLLCKTADAAQQVQSTLEGIKSMVSMSSNADNPDPNAKNMAAAVAGLKSTVNDKTMTVDWPVSSDLIGQILGQGAPATAPTTAPAASQ